MLKPRHSLLLWLLLWQLQCWKLELICLQGNSNALDSHQHRSRPPNVLTIGSGRREGFAPSTLYSTACHKRRCTPSNQRQQQAVAKHSGNASVHKLKLSTRPQWRSQMQPPQSALVGQMLGSEAASWVSILALSCASQNMFVLCSRHTPLLAQDAIPRGCLLAAAYVGTAVVGLH